jgi:hypothetical protein
MTAFFLWHPSGIMLTDMFGDRAEHLELKYRCHCRLHGATVAEMPLIATCSENRQQGMCRQLVEYIEEVRI